MKNITFKTLLTCLIAFAGFTVSAQEKNVDYSQFIKPEVLTTQLSQPNTINEDGASISDVEPIYIADGVTVKDLNEIDSASILDITVENNIIYITTKNAALIANTNRTEETLASN